MPGNEQTANTIAYYFECSAGYYNSLPYTQIPHNLNHLSRAGPVYPKNNI